MAGEERVGLFVCLFDSLWGEGEERGRVGNGMEWNGRWVG